MREVLAVVGLIILFNISLTALVIALKR